MARGSSSTQMPSQRVKSNRASRGQSQKQLKRGTRTQRVDSEEEDEDGDSEADVDGDEIEVEGGGVGGSQEVVDINLKANQLARFALFMEHRRMPLRRDEISKKVFGPSSRVSRSFNRVFERAQFILNHTFGMELVELQSRAAMDKAVAAGEPSSLDEEQDQDDEGPAPTQRKGRGKAIGLKKRAPPPGSKSYILRSTLHPTIISLAALPDEEILSAELDDAPDELDDDGTPAPSQTQGGRRRSRRSQSANTSPPTCTGTILSFSSPTLPALENAGAIAIQYVILSIILTSGRLISDRELRAALRQLHLPPGASVPIGRKAYLQLLIRQGYIDRIVSGEAGKPARAAGGKRGRASTALVNIDGEDGENKYEWRWGPRAHSEIGEKAVQEFVAEFMVGIGGNEDDQDGRNNRGGGGRSVGGSNRPQNNVTKLKKMMDGIEKAAGGNIADLK
ncbi:MAGE family-domain-containing protein [Lentinula aciculospora]|uniref:MAGE family-domain-containing protein n=1 Tax=Lentinula aciculospora TaxID=153920 RepID=A0A9W9DRF9_9AGAR|nr:MAGE family-domain-containing protein [Lentinula aciculospora]